MKQNSRPIIGEVAKSPGVGLDKLDRAVESFSASIVDSVLAVVEQASQVAPEHLDHFFDRLQTAAHGVVGPCVEEAFGRPRVVIAPELSKRFFDTPCPAGLEVELVQGAERNRLGRTFISIALESRPFAARQRRGARQSQAAVFLSAHRIDRFTEVLGNGGVISTLDGFFAALVLNPRLLMPSEYLPWIWDMEQGEDAPAFASLEQANRILQLVMRYYNSVLTTIGNDDFAPLFYTLAQEDGSEFFDAEGWSMGFMRGVLLFVEPWEEVFEKHPEFLVPMVLLGTEQGWDTLEKSPDGKQATQDAYESIAGAVALLHDHFSEQREAETQKRLAQPGRAPSGLVSDVMDMPNARFKVGRNEECLCGSGKKFKKCCGAPPTVH